jgi:hypothetical protein
MPPDLGIIVPNSSMTIAPHVDIAPAITQRMRDIPGLPLSLKIEEGVENILIGVSISKNQAKRTQMGHTRLRQFC